MALGQYHPSFYPGGYGYHPNYFKRPSCTDKNQCYNYMMILIVDDILDFSEGNATQFKEHYRMAGFDRAGMITEGKRAAVFLKEKYGVDVTNLPDDDTYLAPSVDLANGMKFNFVTVRPTLYMASRKDQAKFYNLPASAVWWNIDFSQDFVSTGTYSGTIPAGARVYYGSYVGDTCPDQGRYPWQCMLSNKPFGRKFFRFWPPHYETNYQPGPFVMLNSVLDDAEWGFGQSLGVFIFNDKTGVTTGYDVLTFPATCSSQDKCYSGQRHAPYG